jgi:hypothetical protein
MEVQVKYALPGVGANVGYEPPSPLDSASHPGGNVEQRSQQLGVSSLQLFGGRYMAAGNNEHVRGSGRVDVVERHDIVGFDDNISRDLPGRDRAKQAIGHGLSDLLDRGDA